MFCLQGNPGDPGIRGPTVRITHIEACIHIHTLLLTISNTSLHVDMCFKQGPMGPNGPPGPRGVKVSLNISLCYPLLHVLIPLFVTCWPRS